METNHCQEYVGVPVGGIPPVTTSTWPAFIEVVLTVGTAGAVSAEFTVTANAGDEVCVSGDVALSITT
jgi:hypothetical protein